MKSQGRREPGHFFPRLLQRDRSYRRKTMDTHEPPSGIWAPFILLLWPGVKHDTRRCETGTPSLLRHSQSQTGGTAADNMQSK